MWLSPTPIPLGAGPRGGDCYHELPRIPLLRTTVNKGKKKGRSYNARPFKCCQSGMDFASYS